MNWIRRWLLSSLHRPGLDSLLAQAPAPTAELRIRLEWMTGLVSWVRTLGPSAAELQEKAGKVGRVESARAKYILQVLDNNLAYKLRVAECLRSIIRDTRALELFMHVGVSTQQGFFGEVMERFLLRVLPQPSHDRDLVFLFAGTFYLESDAVWIRRMDAGTFQRWIELFHHTDGGVPLPWNTLAVDARDALFLLGQSIRATGLSRLVRNRVAQADFRRLPFYELGIRIDRINSLDANHSSPRTVAIVPDAERVRAYADIDESITACFATLEEVHAHFRRHGVTIEQVYQVECLRTQLRRARTLARLLEGRDQGPNFIQDFFSLLVSENVRARKLRKLLKDNLSLVCQKIVETNAETGEHYITRDRTEYFQIIKQSWGGGALTGLTTTIKFALGHVSAPPFILGLCAFGNYSVSFLGLQYLGFTLATKQPAMTATALASKIEEASDSVDALADEVVHLMRSQLAAVMGNITAVVPMVMFLYVFFKAAIDWEMTDVHHAEATIHSFSLLGPTPIYAAETGVILWISSVFAGWFGNWFNLRGLPEALERHHRLKFVFGERGAKRIAVLAETHVVGVASSLSLAFLLAMTPLFATFIGLPLDVRHVTLSSGALTASAMAIGAPVLSTTGFWLAVAGVLSMGLLNLTVAFALALTVAIWAKKSSGPKRGVIYRTLIRKVLGQPWRLFFPPRVDVAPAST